MALKDVYITHPAMSLVPRRSLPGSALGAATPGALKVFLTGRWVVVNGDNNFEIVGATRDLNNAYGLYWLIEGTHVHIGTNLEFVAATYLSSNFVELPSCKVQGALAGAYGVFCGTVGPEGVDPTDAGIVNGAELTVDAFGRLITAQAGNVRVAICETVYRDAATNITKMDFRTTGN